MEPDFRPDPKTPSARAFPETPSNRVLKAALCLLHSLQTQQNTW